MQALTNLKMALFRRRMVQETQAPVPGNPRSGPVNFTSAKHIIVLFPADDAANRKAVLKWKEEHRTAKRTIKPIGWFSHDFGAADFEFPAIGPKQCNWFGAPRGEVYDRYCNQDCDLLLRLGPTDHPELDYLAATKATRLKVGPYHATNDTPIYQLRFDAAGHSRLTDQLCAIEAIFAFTNA